ncbi:MAG TPA: hypothetical protein VHW44_08050 [Pseudonocardiaceae bacterium]|jgi:hypothetical protein|nr:hypothetical protein [Pseudonocardiaceae bacterium]
MDISLRGLLHDLEHGMVTLSILLEVVRGDPTLPADSGARLGRASDELTRLLDFLAGWAAGEVAA